LSYRAFLTLIVPLRLSGAAYSVNTAASAGLNASPVWVPLLDSASPPLA
jgi:hypothetical protein